MKPAIVVVPSSRPVLLPGQGRRFVAQNVDLRALIHCAYALHAYQNVEGDAPLLDQRFHVTAVAAEEVTPTPRGQPGPFKAMTQALLEQRFGLVVRWEEREGTSASLVLAQPDEGQLGPGLHPSDVDCDALEAQGDLSGEIARSCGFTHVGGRLHVVGRRLPQLAEYLSGVLLHQVVDRTGLAGPFEIDMTFSFVGLPAFASLVDGIAAASRQRGIDPDKVIASFADRDPALLTALEEELGLRLVSQPAQVPVLIVEHVEPPTPN